jgi:hypothetical protein
MILQKKYLACNDVPVFNLTSLKLDQVNCSTHYIVTSEEHSPESLGQNFVATYRVNVFMGGMVLLRRVQ